jgi:rubrerythrin
MIYQVGQKVFWNDPDDGQTSAIYEIVQQLDDEIVLLRNEHSETGAYLHELSHLDEVYMCKECGGFDIEELMWCTVNKKINEIKECGPDGYYCNSCEKSFDDQLPICASTLIK